MNKRRALQFHLRNWLNNEGMSQVALLPHVEIYWDKDRTVCVGIGWFSLCCEWWFNASDDLV